ncbi:MAG TPA: YihY/virulence factor BrkB family protein [Ardenticatenaceae bacterium]
MTPGRGVSQRLEAGGDLRQEQVTGRVEAVRQWSLTVWQILKETWQEFSADDGATRAAAIGYYALFSIFPITVLLALGLTYLVGEDEARIQVVLLTARYLPTGISLVGDIVESVLENRGTISLIALVAILWGGVQLFRVLERAINQAWGAPRRRNFWRNLLFSLAMITTMGVLTGISVAATALFNVGQHFNLPFIHWAPLENRVVWAFVAAIPPVALTTSLFALLYRYVPHRLHVPWRDVVPSALLAATFWELAKQGYGYYLANFARQSFNLLYGSLGALIGLLTWVYVAGYIILLGAEFCAVLSRHRQDQEEKREPVWADEIED